MALTNADLPKLVELLNLIDIRVQERRRTAAEWVALNEVLIEGEVGLETDTGRSKTGNGVTAWNSLGYTDGDLSRYFAAAGGTANAITATLASFPSLVDGMEFRVRALAANTTTNPTFNPNGKGALTIYKFGGQALGAGDIYGAGHELILRYRASPARYELMTPAASSATWGSITGTLSAQTDLQAALDAKLDDSQIDTDGTLAANSDARIPSQKAVKTAIANAVTGLWSVKGSTDCSASPNYPAAAKGDAYVVSVAGKIGGASGTSVDVGDTYVALIANAGGTEAAVGTSWFHIEHNLIGVLLAANNLSDLTNAATARSNLALGTLATQSGTFSGTSSGVNTGDQTLAGLGGQPLDSDLTALAAISGVRGDVIFYGASGWTRLGTGTAGYLLQCGGTGADPSYIAPSAASAGVGQQIGYAYTQSTTVASDTGATPIPLDNTIPQITEGVAYASLDTAYTPLFATSLLEIEVRLDCSCSTVQSLRFALFRDSGANAIAATIISVQADLVLPMVLRVKVAASSTTATTFKLRWAAAAATGYINRASSISAIFGGAMFATMTVREIKQ